MNRHPEHIEDTIEHTRSRIEDRLTDLGDQMSPTRLMNSLFRSNGESPMDSVESLVKKARENPVPALLIGTGLAGLLLSKRNGTSSDNQDYTSRHSSDDAAARIGENAADLKRRANEMGRNVAQAASELSEAAKSGISAARETASGMVDSASEYASQTAQTATDKSSEVRGQAEHLLSQAGSRVEMSKRRIRHEARQTRMRADSATTWVKENPVPAGLAALAIGAAAASIFATRRSVEDNDDQRAGSISDEVASRSLHREAQNAEPESAVKGSARFVGMQESSQETTGSGSPAQSHTRQKKAKTASTKPRSKTTVSTVMKDLNKPQKPATRKTEAKPSIASEKKTSPTG